MKASITRGRCDLVRASVVAGLVAGAAMVPVGAVLRATGHAVNVYGELLTRSLLGSTPFIALFALHAVISVALAVPFVAVTRCRGGAGPALGAAYGVASWAVLNATLLPLWYGRPTAWALGFAAVWPGLLVHLIYGITLGLVARRLGTSATCRS